MADSTERVVQIIFSGQDNASAAINSIGESNVKLQMQLEKTKSVAGADMFSGMTSGFGALHAAFDNIVNAAAKVADSVIKIDVALAGLAVGGLALVINETSKFQSGFAEISTLFNAPTAGVEKFRQSILDYSTSSVYSIDQINKATYQAISAGYDYDKALQIVSASEKFATTGRADIVAATNLLTGTMNNYNAKSSETTKYMDIFFQMVKDGKTALTELAASFSLVGGAAAGNNIPLETMGAAIASLTAKGMPTAQVMTALKEIISNMTKPSEQAKEMSESLGLAFSAQALSAKGLDGVLKDVMTRTKGNSTALNQLFGSVEAVNAIQMLYKDNLVKFNTEMTNMKNVAGNVEDAYKKMAGTIDNQTQMLKNNVAKVFIDIGDKISGDFVDQIRGISNIWKSIDFSINKGAFDQFFGAIENLSIKLQLFMADIAKNIPEALQKVDFSKLIQSIERVGEALSKAFSIDASNPKALADAIQFAVNTIESLMRVTAGMIDGFKPFIDTIRSSIQQFNELDDSQKEATGSALALVKMIKEAGIAFVALRTGTGGANSELVRVAKVLAGEVLTGVSIVKIAFDGLVLVVADAAKTFLGLAASLTPDALGGKKLRAMADDWTAYADAVRGVGANDLNLLDKGLNLIGESLGGVSEKTNAGSKAIKELGASAALAAPEINQAGNAVAKLVEETSSGKALQIKFETKLNSLNIAQNVNELMALAQAEADKSKMELRLKPLLDQNKTQADLVKLLDDAEQMCAKNALMVKIQAQVDRDKIKIDFEGLVEDLKKNGQTDANTIRLLAMFNKDKPIESLNAIYEEMKKETEKQTLQVKYQAKIDEINLKDVNAQMQQQADKEKFDLKVAVAAQTEKDNYGTWAKAEKTKAESVVEKCFHAESGIPVKVPMMLDIEAASPAGGGYGTLEALVKSQYDKTTKIITDIYGEKHVYKTSVELDFDLGATPGSVQRKIDAAYGKDISLRVPMKFADEDLAKYKNEGAKAIEAANAQISAEKALEINIKYKMDQYKAETERIKDQIVEDTKRIQAAMDALTKIQVTKIQEDSKQVLAAYDNMAKGLQGSAEIIKTALGSIGTAADKLGEMSPTVEAMKQVMLREMTLREQMVKDQSKLIDAQVELLRVRADKLKSGDPQIIVKADGLKPYLEGICYEMFQFMQTKFSGEASELLLNMTSQLTM
ncbi:MAG: phage tail tape measure protein [Deltaproteobacteria bacterium]|nr:phage tail tape measure protein [Deltaproteobacteria bacterium]